MSNYSITYLVMYLEVATFTRCTRRIRIQHTRRCIATRVVTMSLHSTVTLLTSFHKPIPTDWTVKKAATE